jgi:hypothetical protein
VLVEAGDVAEARCHRTLRDGGERAKCKGYLVTVEESDQFVIVILAGRRSGSIQHRAVCRWRADSNDSAASLKAGNEIVGLFAEGRTASLCR